MGDKNRGSFSIVWKVVLALVVLLVIVHTLLVISSGASARDMVAQMKADGYPMTLEEITPKMPADDADNSAEEFHQIFELICAESEQPYDRKKQTGDVSKGFQAIAELHKPETCAANLRTEEMAKLKASFANEDFIRLFTLINKAARKPQCIMKRDYTQGPATVIPGLNLYRTVCHLLILRARYEAQSGDSSGAIPFLLQALKVSDVLRSDPILISQMIRVANARTVMAAIQAHSQKHAIAATDLAALRTKMQPFRDLKPIQYGLDGERILFGQWFFEKKNTLKLQGEARTWRYYHTYPCRPFFNADYSSYLSVMKYFSDQYKVPFKQVLTQDDDTEVMKRIKSYAFFTRMAAPSLSKMRHTAEGAKVCVDLTNISIACNEYKRKNGTYPKSLKELGEQPRDPATETDYIYKKADSGYVLYSPHVGYNGRLSYDGKDRLMGYEVK